MITKIEVKGYRCLRYVSRSLNPFMVLIGPNASGKTTFLDVLGFVGDVVSQGLGNAIGARATDYNDLTWNQKGADIEIAVEAEIPQSMRKLYDRPIELFRYELRIGHEGAAHEIGIIAENAWLIEKPRKRVIVEPVELFPLDKIPPDTILTKYTKVKKRVLSKSVTGNDTFYSETTKGWVPSFKLGPKRSALGNLPEDESRFPAATWFKRLLMDGVQKIMLNSMKLRNPSPAIKSVGFASDGSNLPWIVHRLETKENSERYGWWLSHIQTALPEVEAIRTTQREEDRSRYILIKYKGGLEVPSWLASDGTLRLLALTVPAFVPDFSGICLIEEPENGIHPRAVETIYQSLSSVYGAQFLVATHSPTVLGMADPNKVLCFKKSESGATDIVRGDEHPALRSWKGKVSLSEFYAGGVL